MKALSVVALMFCGFVLSHVNGQEAAPAPTPVPEHGTIVEAAPGALFPHVKYKDLNEMAPCAVPRIIAVNDPCACEDPCASCKKPCGCEKSCGCEKTCGCVEKKLVYIQICVPECSCEEEVICRRDGDRVRYDFGKYAVDVRVKKGHIEVDYQD
jgi:hypothetical protein